MKRKKNLRSLFWCNNPENDISAILGSGIKKVCSASKAHPEMYSACCHTAFLVSNKENRSTKSQLVLCVVKIKIIQLCDEYGLPYSGVVRQAFFKFRKK